jgi:hypothetical protein
LWGRSTLAKKEKASIFDLPENQQGEDMKSGLKTHHFTSDKYTAVCPDAGSARLTCSCATESEHAERFSDDREDVRSSISSDRTIIDE